MRAQLAADERLRGQQLPGRSSIAGFLKEQGLTRPYERHSDLPQPQVRTAHAPHEEWEMDARGYQRVPDVGVIALINLNDVFSRVKLLSYPCWSGQKRVSRHPTTEDYQLVWIHQEVEITFDCQHQQLLFRSADGEQTKRL